MYTCSNQQMHTCSDILNAAFLKRYIIKRCLYKHAMYTCSNQQMHTCSIVVSCTSFNAAFSYIPAHKKHIHHIQQHTHQHMHTCSTMYIIKCTYSFSYTPHTQVTCTSYTAIYTSAHARMYIIYSNIYISTCTHPCTYTPHTHK